MPLLEQIQASGELKVVTSNSPTTYYLERGRRRGLEYELATRFARHLGVEARFSILNSPEEILAAVISGEAHIAAAGLTATRGREQRVRFSRSYQSITRQLVYREGGDRPEDILATQSGAFEVVAGSGHEERLRELQQQLPGLEWTASSGLTSSELMALVYEELIDYTMANSNEVALIRRYHPELKVALDLSQPLPLAWALQHSHDNSLFDAVQTFLRELQKSGELQRLVDRYYGYAGTLDALETRIFRRHVVQRLPEYISLFKQAAEETGLDWQLLAAIGYQESHWNADAVSPTGVKGVMMLTRATAKELGVSARTDPAQSILGGARYILKIRNKIPRRIANPDRLWMTLAGYNIGFGHLEDARILTQRHGDDPDSWLDVRKYLPLLSRKKYYESLKHGRARGGEPVAYVDNIRSYQDLLAWELDRNGEPLPSDESDQPEGCGG
ncbi:MAG: membrane-bound lytic murein transglycosylase MltF [Gammaproteobacteria bacterium]|nr:membrane-bound lytic murein transglycosylase MltF [Gammaproteobacteria bacterium]